MDDWAAYLSRPRGEIVALRRWSNGPVGGTADFPSPVAAGRLARRGHGASRSRGGRSEP